MVGVWSGWTDDSFATLHLLRRVGHSRVGRVLCLRPLQMNREDCPQQPCQCSYLGEQLCPFYLSVIEKEDTHEW